MVNKIDTSKLGQHITDLTNLGKQWSGYKKQPQAIGNNSGGTIEQIQEMAKVLQSTQDALQLLITNTVSYMQQRKESVDTKDSAAANAVKK